MLGLCGTLAAQSPVLFRPCLEAPTTQHMGGEGSRSLSRESHTLPWLEGVPWQLTCELHLDMG